MASAQPISSPVLSNEGHNAGSRKRDAALGKRNAVAVRGDQQRVFDIVEIVERLAHAHHDNVGNLAAFGWNNRAHGRIGIGPIAKAVSCDQQLGKDFLGCQIAHQFLRAGMAEGAGEGAADLGGNAKRAAAFFGNIDGFDINRLARAARGKAHQPFACAVIGNLLLR